MSFNLENYEDVDTRLHKFWEAQGKNGRIMTEIVYQHVNEQGRIDQIIVKATVLDENGIIATGYAEEVLTNYGVNKSSMVEVCETSAIGRALANSGYSAKGNRASRQEMEKVERSGGIDMSAQNYRMGNNAPSEKQRKYALQLMAGRDYLADEFKAERKITGTLNKSQTGEFITWLQERPITAAEIAQDGKPLMDLNWGKE